MTYVIALRDATDRAIAGGKASGCARMMRLGLRVPDGFVVTTRAFREFASRLRLSGLKYEEALCAAMPEDVKRDVVRAFARLKDPVAVRSSATVEDGAATAFAGVFHTSLDVRADRLIDAVMRVWASAFTPEARTHALRHNIDPRRIEMAVLVQEMLAPESSGVMHTGGTIVRTDGRGDALVDGRVRGEAIQNERLAAAGRRLEKRFGRPLDIEWAMQGGELWFLQARPITAMEPSRGITWTRALSEERFPAPISPLGWSALEEILPVNLVTLRKRFGLVARRPDEVARTIGHYVYSNEKFFSIPGSMRINPLRQARFAHHYIAALGSILWNAPRAIGRLGDLALSRLFRAFVFPHAREVRRAWDTQLARHLREMDAFDGADLRGSTLPALMSGRHAMVEAARRYMEPDLAIYVIKMACSWMVERLGGDLAQLTAGLGDNRTLAMNADFARLYVALQGRALEEGRYDELLAHPALQRFIERNGHTTTNWDLREPTWGEDPRRILEMLHSYSSAVMRRDPAADERSRRETRVAARGRVSGSLPDWLAPFFDETLATLHEFVRIDEEHHFYCSRLFRPMRRLYAELGAHLVGMIDRAEDVWFLTVPEIEEAFANPFPRRHLVELRKTSFERARSVRPPDRYLDSRPLVTAASENHELRGEGASPGIARGLVRVVETTAEAAAFRPGEILVTPSPNPAWTPIYAVAGALVTATGSILSHGLVSAREYGLPAVIGIPDVTRRLLTGQRVRVDGHEGVVCVE